MITWVREQENWAPQDQTLGDPWWETTSSPPYLVSYIKSKQLCIKYINVTINGATVLDTEHQSVVGSVSWWREDPVPQRSP